jgi:hypothetical protein
MGWPAAGQSARGGWVDEPHTAKGYQSDFDLLIIVNEDRLTDRVQYWVKAKERLIRELAITKTLRTPVNFIVHSLHEVNDGLAHGRFFFMGVRRDGMRSTRPMTANSRSKPKTSDQALAMANEYFEEWYPSGSDYFNGYKDAVHRGSLKKLLSTYTKRQNDFIIACCRSAPSTRRTSTISAFSAHSPSGWIADDIRLADGDAQRARDVREAEGRLREGALFEALPHLCRGAGVARRLRRGARAGRPGGLSRAHSNARAERSSLVQSCSVLAKG